jgi:MOSC domain-containing protein YiiM
MKGTLTQLSISNGGIVKTGIHSARVGIDGVAGDWQRDRKNHGGPERAVCLFSQEQYAWLRKEHGIDLQPGNVGENFTTRGIDLQKLAPGDRLRVGQCLIEITKVRVPCYKLRRWHPRLDMIVEGRSGWMAKVIEAGEVHPGDPIEVLKSNAPIAP